MNNCHYKSALQAYNKATQAFVATNTVSNPVTLALGTQVTGTGTSIDLGSAGITIENGGLYRVSADIGITGVTAGTAYVAMTLDGTVMQETLKAVTIDAGTTVNVAIESIRRFATCCQMASHTIGVIVYSDGTGVGNVVSVSVNAIKEA